MPLFRALSQHCLCFSKSEPWQLHGWLSVVDEVDELVEVEVLDVVVGDVVGLDVVVEEVVELDVVVEEIVELDVVVEEVVVLDVVVGDVAEVVEGQITSSATQAPR